MIKYNNSNIIDWNFDDNDIIKVYHNGAVVFYKFDSEQGGYKVCYAVVDDITQYQETEFEDVYDKATEKWHKLNNLNQYEEYGVYASGRTSCEGSASRLPQGYTEVEYIENTGTTSSNGAYLNLGLPLYNTIGNSFVITSRLKSEYYSASGYDVLETIINSESVSSPYYGFVYRYAYSTHNIELAVNPSSHATLSTTANTDGTTSITISCNSTSVTDQVPLGLFASYNTNYNTPYRFAKATIYSLTVVKNGITVRDFVPAKRDSDSVYGLYDLINDVFYTSPNGNNFIGGEPVTPPCVTTYEGKLTIDDGYEYEWNGSSWVNLGEVSGSSRLPIGYTEVEYVQNTGTSYFNTNFKPNTNTRIVADMQQVTANDYPRLFGCNNWNATAGMNVNYEGGYLQISWFGKTSWTKITSIPNNFDRHVYDLNKNNLYVDETLVASTTYSSLYQSSDNLGIFFEMSGGRPGQAAYFTQEAFKGKMYSFQIYDNGTLVRDLVPCIRDNDNTIGAYDIVNDVFYTVPTGYTTDKLIAGAETGATEYPKYYSEKSEPLDDLTFNTLAEAQAYAEANCVYDGMHATIGADRYYFDSTDENGWVKILEYYKFEDVTPGGSSGWTISGSSTYNPDSSYYDDFDLQTTSTSNVTKIAKVTIYGYERFTYYLRTSGYSNYCYAVATNVDEISTPPSTMGYTTSSAITNTYNWNKTPKSVVNLSNYRRVTYNNLDKTVEHTFYVYFYGRTYSRYVGNATILIPKEQTNENWEQVTFSASSNVASSQKSLYIDGNNSTSGGTDRFYYRWIVGLPSGSHSSYTNYSNYDYCPNVTSSTFTSVVGNSRQVDFTYNNTTNKSLSFRLVDSNGNVLSPSNTVYYYTTTYNSCGGGNSTLKSFPRTDNVKAGGRFRFANSSNRHYIYGYSPNISLNTDYYVNNYQSTFDITYAKLSEEAVTVTYTTYDPSDVETPAFKTDIIYPYNGGSTSSTTLTSYDVPYTYPYVVVQTSDKFSADSQTYTAGQASRTITFTLYPNNREFATVADMEAYAYAWEGMRANVGDTNYEYKNGEWVEYAGTIWLDPSATNALFSIGHYWGENYKIVFTTYLSGSYSGDFGSFWQGNGHTPIELSFYSNGFYYDMHNPTSTTAPNVRTTDYDYRILRQNAFSSYENSQKIKITLTYGSFKAELEETGAVIYSSGSTRTGFSWYDGLYQVNIGLNNASAKCHLSHIQIYNGNNELVNDLKFIKNNGVVGSQEISIYDSVTNTTYNNTNSNTPVYHIEI